jgi:mono/diheme cytochrome c family protein
MPKWICAILFGLAFAALIGSGDVVVANAVTPFERAAGTPRGELHSPYADFASVAGDGHKIYLAHDCNGCHGGGGGGGMAAPLTNEIWIYGNDDDTLFRVIALGTGSLSPGGTFQKQGFVRKGSENVVGPMPHFGDIFKTDSDIWKIIAWLRATNCERRPAQC